MSRSILWLLAGGWLFSSAGAWGATPQDAAPAALVPKELAAVDAASLAYFQGDPAGVLESLAPLVARADDARLEAIEQRLAGHSLPAAGALLAQARRTLVLHGLGQDLPRISAREAVLALPELDRELQVVWQALDDSPVMSDPLPDPVSLAEYERLLWDVHVLENRLATAQQVAGPMRELARAVPRKQIEKLGERDRQIVQADYAAAVERLRAAGAELEEREIELRIQRLGLAESRLGEPELTADKFLAAFAWSVDAPLVQEFLARPRQGRPYARHELNDPLLARSVERQADRCRQAAGDLTLKAQLLYEGLHWWLRGRYGAGTEVGGLVKSPAALSSEEAQFALYLPADWPKPTDPAVRDGAAPVPTWDRRHHYWWAFGEQQITRGGFETLTTVTNRTETLQTVNTRFY